MSARATDSDGDGAPGPGSQSRGKLWIAAVTAAGTIATAAVSAGVSWFVSERTLELDHWRAQAEDSIQRAELFTDLMQHVTTDGKAGYAILALWKLYQDDRKLVVISALQSEDPQALTVLHQLGLERELKGYEQTIRNVIDRVGDQRRKELLQLYSEIDPSGIVDLSVHRVLEESSAALAQSKAFDELVDLLRDRPDLRGRVAQLMSSDRRLQASVRGRFALALALYVAGETETFDRMIVESEGDIDLFAKLAPLIKAGGQKVRYEVRDQEKLLRLSVQLMRASSGGAKKKAQFYGALEVFRDAFPHAGVTSSERPAIVQMFEDHYRVIPEDRLARERILNTVWQLDQEAARRLYHSAVVCEKLEDSRPFFFTVEVPDLLFPSEKPATYEAAHALGLSHLNIHNLTCESWRA